ncbi:MAG: NAD(P)H-dependent oxidoreductase, partial [Anaerolineae bacterium]
MKITVLNGSPKGIKSVTMQYVLYIQKMFTQHELDIVNIAQQIKKIEHDEQAFQETIEKIQASDGVLWAFPLYILHVHGNYKRFIEMIWERGVEDAFENKYAAALSTSIHFFDHTAHNYIHAICDDLKMRFVNSFSAEMQDLLKDEGRAKLIAFADGFFEAIQANAPTPRAYAPVTRREFDYTPTPEESPIASNGKKVVVVTDAEPHQTNLIHMIERFKAALAGKVEVINLHDIDIKGGCLGCLRCGYDYQCAYVDKDGFIDFYNKKLKTSDIIIFAGAIKDRYLSSLWKTFFDRSFFNTHTPSLTGKQFGFIISGPLSQIPNLREILEGWTQFQHSNLVGFVTDEATSNVGDNSAATDGLLHDLARRLVRCANGGYIQPQTFLGVGGIKVFRDDVWGELRIPFQADHRAYKRLGIYDFPHKDIRVRLLNTLVAPLFRIPKVREEFTKNIKEGMIQP